MKSEQRELVGLGLAFLFELAAAIWLYFSIESNFWKGFVPIIMLVANLIIFYSFLCIRDRDTKEKT